MALASEMRSRPGQQSKDDLTLIHEGTAFLKNVSEEEPGTFIDFILDLCSDVENSSRRATQQVRIENNGPLAQANDDTVDLDIDMAGRQQPTGHGDSTFSNSDADLLNDINLNYINPQWAFPPFWNWQDMLGMPVSGPE